MTKPNQQNNSKREPARNPTRYSVRADDGTKVEEIYLGTDKAEAIKRAEKRHAETGAKVWTWSLKSGRTIHRIERAEVAADGGR